MSEVTGISSGGSQRDIVGAHHEKGVNNMWQILFIIIIILRSRLRASAFVI